jgi:predicted nucleic acid-binding Zn finger protein
MKKKEENSHEFPFSLHLLFGEKCLLALDILDRYTITRYECPAGRHFYRLVYPDRSYLILADAPSCTCPFFTQVERATVCKHILAVWVARALATYETTPISDKEYADLLEV